MNEPSDRFSFSFWHDLVGSAASDTKRRKSSLSDIPVKDTAVFSLSSPLFQQLLGTKDKGIAQDDAGDLPRRERDRRKEDDRSEQTHSVRCLYWQQ